MSLFSRGTATLAGAALLGSLAAVVPASTASAATTDPTPAQLAATWMSKNLSSEGLLPQVPWGGTTAAPSVGRTLDFASTLRAIPGQSSTLGRIRTGITANATSYTADGTIASATANLLAWSVDEKASPTVGGIDTLAKVSDMVTATGPTQGMIDDQTGGYATTWTQIWGVKGLLANDSAKAVDAAGFLSKQQCPSGVVRDAIDTTGATCSTPDSWQGGDTTALAVIQLSPYKNDPAVAPFLVKAVAYLKTLQQPSGAFVDPSLGTNSNSTGLSARALGAYGDTAAATKAATWLRSLQVLGACGAGKLAPENGALAYDAAELRNAATTGISDAADRDQWIFVGSQAIGALTYAPAAAAPDAVEGPTFVPSGSAFNVTVKGLAPGERACLGSLVLSGTGAPLSVRVSGTLPAAITLTSATGTVRGSTMALAPTRLKPIAPTKVKRTKAVKVTVKGLAPGEQVTVTLRGRKVLAGKATAKGVFSKKFKVKAKNRRGKAVLKVTGQYATRTGKKTLKIR